MLCRAAGRGGDPADAQGTPGGRGKERDTLLLLSQPPLSLSDLLWIGPLTAGVPESLGVQPQVSAPGSEQKRGRGRVRDAERRDMVPGERGLGLLSSPAAHAATPRAGVRVGRAPSWGLTGELIPWPFLGLWPLCEASDGWKISQ